MFDLVGLSHAERRQGVETRIGGREQRLDDVSIHHLISAQATRTPDTVAILGEQEQLTYRELEERVNRLARYLQRFGVGPEVLVGICLERSPEMIVALLAVLKAGGAFIALDPTHPQERLIYVLQDSRVTLVLTERQLMDRLQGHQAQLICLDADWPHIAEELGTAPRSEVTGENAAYVIYTSGSTGAPKGVLIPHRAIAEHCQAVIEHFHLSAEDRILQFSTFTFDAALEQIFPTLIVGATLLLRGSEVWSPAELRQKMLESGLTVVNLPTAYWHQCAQAWASEREQVQGYALRLMIVGGDRMLPHYLQFWRQAPLRSARLLNAYGPTETTITATTYEVPTPSDGEEMPQRVPIGRPIGRRTAYILDEQLHPVSSGEAGELYIGGSMLARGYLRRPQLTAERFLADPFSAEPQARMYKTGDLVRALPDGTIDFLGRVDEQVKIRGFRIEPAEIEGALKQQAEVREAVVAAREDATGEKRLVAYIVPEQEQMSSLNDLREALKEKLPQYMLPSAFVLLHELPMTPNGKIDRRALPAPESSIRPTGDPYVAPGLLVHHQLVSIWEELLEVRPIGIRDNFFALGGHSLLAIRMFSAIEQLFGKKLSPALLFSGATIEHLAVALQEQEVASARTPLVAIQAHGTKRPFFYLHGDWTGAALYCLPLARDLGPEQPFYVMEPYNFEGLRALPSFAEMVRAHLQTMRQVQPEGPYLLGGFCNGALVAFEMARQLQQEGQRVDALILVDVGYTPKRAWFTHKVLRGIGDLLHINQEKQLNSFLRVRHLYKLLQPSRKARRQDILYVSNLDPRLRALFPPIDALRKDYVGLFTWVASSYLPPRYPGKVTFFWDGEETSLKKRGSGLPQGEESEVYIIPGTHKTCRTEHIHDFARQLRTCLDMVQQSAVR